MAKLEKDQNKHKDLQDARVQKRAPAPQNSQCWKEKLEYDSDDSSVPFADMLSYGTNGSPTITLTKTLFSQGEVTSITSDISNTSGNEGTGNHRNFSLSIAPFIGVVSAPVTTLV